MDPTTAAPAAVEAAQTAASAAPGLPVWALLLLLIPLFGATGGGIATFLRFFPFWPAAWLQKKPLACPTCMAFWSTVLAVIGWHPFIAGGRPLAVADVLVLTLTGLAGFGLAAWITNEALPPPMSLDGMLDDSPMMQAMLGPLPGSHGFLQTAAPALSPRDAREAAKANWPFGYEEDGTPRPPPGMKRAPGGSFSPIE